MENEREYFKTAERDVNREAPSFYRRLVLSSLSRMTRGRLQIDLPDGTVAAFGEGPADLPLEVAGAAHIRVLREGFFRKCVFSGDIGFAESYIDGDWSSPDLVAVVSWFILNIEDAPTMSGSRRASRLALNLLRQVNRFGQFLRPNSPSKARRNISEHYDLSNDFFSLFLDPSMMYSAAKWTRPGQTLEEAQGEKNERLCRMLKLGAGDHVLEIGTGWGGWAVHAAKAHGCRVTTVTLSRQQADYATRRVQKEGLQDRIEVRFQDFRAIEGVYDKIVSIEMMEALGHAYLPDFCRVVGRSLKADGLVALQFITCPDMRYTEFRKGVDFIQKHVFPGSLLLSLNRVNDQLARQAGLALHDSHDMGRDYALTLRKWAETFSGRIAEVRNLGFEDRFIRKWRYYLAYCEAAFALRNISVVQTVHSRPNNFTL